MVGGAAGGRIGGGFVGGGPMRPLPSAFPPPCSPLAPPAAVSSLEAAPAVCAAAASRRLRNSSSCEHVSALLPSSSLPCSSSVFCHVPCVFQHPDRHVVVGPWRSEAVDVRGSKWNANSTVFGFERLSLNSKVNIAGLKERGAPTQEGEPIVRRTKHTREGNPSRWSRLSR